MRTRTHEEYRTFVQENSRPLSPVLLPEMRLWTAHESLPLWTRAQEWIEKDEIPIPFWAFPWVGGQAVARWVLDHPDVVAGKDVVDFGSGSGIVAIAAKMAGARRVWACDIDPFSRAAIELNSQLNDVDLEIPEFDVMGEFPASCTVLTAGDMFYEREPSKIFSAWFLSLRPAVEVVAGDPGRHYVPKDLLEEMAVYEVPTTRELEDADVRTTRVYRFR